MIVLITTAPEIVNANWRNNCPVIPPRNAAGTNTASNTSVVAMTGPVISCMALVAAAVGLSPLSRCRAVFSTTTMASSTTMPMASTMPNRVSMLIEKPIADMIANVPTNETGIAAHGITVARQSCRNRKITRTTRTTACISVT